MPKPVRYGVSEKMVAYAAVLARRQMKDSKESKMKMLFGGSFERHTIGKLGEMAFMRFCKDEGIKILHTPFRESYSSLSNYDDFLVEVDGTRKIVEVKTATMQDPGDSYEVVYYNKEQYDERDDRDFLVVFAAIDPVLTEVALLGWLRADIISHFFIRDDIEHPAYMIEVDRLEYMHTIKFKGILGVGIG